MAYDQSPSHCIRDAGPDSRATPTVSNTVQTPVPYLRFRRDQRPHRPVLVLILVPRKNLKSKTPLPVENDSHLFNHFSTSDLHGVHDEETKILKVAECPTHSESPEDSSEADEPARGLNPRLFVRLIRTMIPAQVDRSAATTQHRATIPTVGHPKAIAQQQTNHSRAPTRAHQRRTRQALGVLPRTVKMISKPVLRRAESETKGRLDQLVYLRQFSVTTKNAFPRRPRRFPPKRPI